MKRLPFFYVQNKMRFIWILIIDVLSLILNNKTMDNKAAEKFFIGVQLVAENGKSLMEQGDVSGEMKMRITNIVNQSEKIEAKLWGNMGESAEIIFNQKVAKVEEVCCG